MESHIPLESINIPSPTTTIACAFLIIYGIHLALVYFDVPLLSLSEPLWNAFVYCVPAPLVLDSARRRELRNNAMLSQMHAAKSDALRQVLGFGGHVLLQKLPSAGETLTGGASPVAVTCAAPAGLGNWDNSCYQNSVLQALTSLDTLPLWLNSASNQDEEDAVTTNRTLQDTIAKLRDPVSNGKHLWTPAKLKNMSSWQQQDAQEYFSKIMDELDKEAAKNQISKTATPGLESLLNIGGGCEKDGKAEDGEGRESIHRNPLEGLVAQRVVCTSCGFSEGYTMIPFNCLTVPLGSSMEYSLSECLDEYTKREAIEGVECRRCTLLRARDKIQAMVAPRVVRSDLSATIGKDKVLDLPPELRAQVAQRLEAIQTALSEDDYSDRTLKHACQIPTKSYVSSTKTREAVVGRAPETLVVHVNRSVFDEMTGMQRKNHAHVRYPLTLDLDPWMLGLGDRAAHYRLRAVVTHYGRHENGHYICYRQHPAIDAEIDGKPSLRWWRLSDEDVSSVTEAEVLSQGEVFMLFYERQADHVSSADLAHATQNIAAVPQTDMGMVTVTLEEHDGSSVSVSTPAPSFSAASSSPQSVTSESDTEVEHESTLPECKPQQAPAMRTAPPAKAVHEFSFGRSIMSV